MYFDQMLFLVPTLENRQTTSNLDTFDNEQENDSTIEPQDNDNSDFLQPSLTSRAKKNFRKQTNKISELQRIFIETIKRETGRWKNIDEDKYFLISLLPTFKRFNKEQKFNAKI